MTMFRPCLWSVVCAVFLICGLDSPARTHPAVDLRAIRPNGKCGMKQDFKREHIYDFSHTLDSIGVYVMITRSTHSLPNYDVDGASLVYTAVGPPAHDYYAVQLPVAKGHRIKVAERLAYKKTRPNGFVEYVWPNIEVSDPLPLCINSAGANASRARASSDTGPINPLLKETTGMFIPLNINDSDDDGIPDLDDEYVEGDDPELVAVQIRHPRGAPIQLAWSNDIIHLYERPSKKYGYTDQSRNARLGANIANNPYKGFDDEIVYVEGIRSDTTFLTVTGPGNIHDRIKITVSNVVDIVPDWNHDGVIDDSDMGQAATTNPFRFWINDDNDDGDVADGNSDVPGEGSGNAHDTKVNGRCDLLDFFPVWLDFSKAMELLPGNSTNWVFVLRQADGAVSFFQSDLTRQNAGNYLTEESQSYGPALDARAHLVNVVNVPAGGVDIQNGGSDFLGEIKMDQNKGVVILEGKARTTSPLILEIRKGSKTGKLVCETQLPLSLSSVKDMYRWINLRPGQQNDSRTNVPANNPDSLSNGTNVFFLHGFNVDANAARGWNAEMFKRLYQAGSRAKFWGMTWEGDVGLINALHYQNDVANGLTVSSNFYAQVHGITGDKIVLGHSLGNIVVSSAIQDYGLSVSKYFMLDAAVATECYDPSVFNDATTGNYMLHEDWSGYSNKTWCSTWFRLFSSPDDQEKLTWQNRFPAVMSVAYNFYSSGDEIFEVYAGTPSAFSGGLFHLERRAWQKQEVFKGRGILGGTSWAGWGFSGANVEDDVGNVTFVPEYSAEEANGADEARLRTNAVFMHEPASMFSSNITSETVNDIIAQGVPALSYAAGGNSINIPGFYNYNVDGSANKPNGWGRNGGAYGTHWLHSDLKNMAYLYTYKLFHELVLQGGLQ